MLIYHCRLYVLVNATTTCAVLQSSIPNRGPILWASLLTSVRRPMRLFNHSLFFFPTTTLSFSTMTTMLLLPATTTLLLLMAMTSLLLSIPQRVHVLSNGSEFLLVTLRGHLEEKLFLIRTLLIPWSSSCPSPTSRAKKIFEEKFSPFQWTGRWKFAANGGSWQYFYRRLNASKSARIAYSWR